jgi:hypothetical protein
MCSSAQMWKFIWQMILEIWISQGYHIYEYENPLCKLTPHVHTQIFFPNLKKKVVQLNIYFHLQGLLL